VPFSVTFPTIVEVVEKKI